MNRQTPATEVDHVIPWGDDFNLFWNNEFQGLCKPCHSQKTWYETTKSPYLPKNIRPKSKDIILLIGAIGSGRHKAADSMSATVISMERIRETIGHEHHKIPTCIATRNRMIESKGGKVVIVESLPDPKHRTDWIKKLNAKVMMTITSQHECLKKAKTPAMAEQVRRWYNAFIPLGNEQFV